MELPLSKIEALSSRAISLRSIGNFDYKPVDRSRYISDDKHRTGESDNNNAPLDLALTTGLVVDKETVVAMLSGNLMSLQDYALEFYQKERNAESVATSLNHDLAHAKVAIPKNRQYEFDPLDGKYKKNPRHVVPHAGFFITENIFVSVAHGESNAHTADLRFVCSASWSDDHTDFDSGNFRVYKPVYTSGSTGLSVCKWQCQDIDIVAYKVQAVNCTHDNGRVCVANFDINPKDGVEVTAMSHPFGLPQMTLGTEKLRKVADTSDGNHATYTADLDIFVGCSGSPVFSTEDGIAKIVGLIKSQTGGDGIIQNSADPTELVLAKWTKGSGDDKPVSRIIPIKRVLEKLKEWGN